MTGYFWHERMFWSSDQEQGGNLCHIQAHWSKESEEEPSTLNHWAGGAHVPVFSLGSGSCA